MIDGKNVANFFINTRVVCASLVGMGQNAEILP